MAEDAAPSLIGRQLGAYRLDSLLGAGGMGQVYRARDTKLGRDVAIKVLPSSFADDPERVRRFEREARMLAALNHPHIGTIYGLEDIDGVRALVLELVDGPTLKERVAGGPTPVKEALTIAHQIADALEAAHEKGIIHRDLKPANVKLTRDGNVKVLDFGLAKAFAGGDSGPALSQAPTVTATELRPGAIVGTPAYMSPEQARGQALDKRIDVWAFGCLLYEMLTGRVAFAGDTISDTIAAILGREPDWQKLPQTTPASVRRLLQRCLKKDPKRRLHDIADARIELDDMLSPPAIRGPQSGLRWMWVTASAVLLAAVAGAVTMWRFGPSPQTAPPAVTHLLVDVRPAKHLAGPSREPADSSNRIALAFSPDGRRLAFTAVGADGRQLYLRALDQPQAEPLEGTEGALNPFFSPDGRWVGFWANGQMKRISISGGPAIPLTKQQNPSAQPGARTM